MGKLNNKKVIGRKDAESYVAGMIQANNRSPNLIKLNINKK